MRSLRRPARGLRLAIDAMPLATRQAMLAAIDRNPIIVGAYTAPGGGVCPMLAAHRNGGRTDYAEFARAWDRYARAGRHPRPASEGELTALRTMLEASIPPLPSAGPGRWRPQSPTTGARSEHACAARSTRSRPTSGPIHARSTGPSRPGGQTTRSPDRRAPLARILKPALSRTGNCLVVSPGHICSLR